MTAKIIPIALTFDERYVIPAGVAMLSLMEHADPNYFYEFNIIHHGLSIDSQKKLADNLKSFANQKIKYIYAEYSFADVFEQLNQQQHFSPEMFYKLILPSLLPGYDKVIVSDVDVVFMGDISPAYLNFTSDKYIAAIKHYSQILTVGLNTVYKKFSPDYQNRVNNFGAGFMVYNLKKMRQDQIEMQMLEFLKQNIKKLIYPEQEVLNYVCSPQTEYISLKYMMGASWVKDEISQLKSLQQYYSPYTLSEITEAFEKPVQLHYASALKPWNSPECYRLEIWFAALSKTIFVKDYLKYICQEQRNCCKNILSDIYNAPRNRLRYFLYKSLSKITLGQTRKAYKQKCKGIKVKFRKIQNYLKSV